MKKLSEIKIDKDYGKFSDIVDLYKAIGQLNLKSFDHEFKIHVSIVETIGRKEKAVEHQIGEVAEIDGVKYRCVKANGRDCSACAFYEDDETHCGFPMGCCSEDYRSDETDVIFEKYENQHN